MLQTALSFLSCLKPGRRWRATELPQYPPYNFIFAVPSDSHSYLDLVRLQPLPPPRWCPSGFPLVLHCTSCNQLYCTKSANSWGQADFPFFLLFSHCTGLSTRGMRPPDTITIQTLSAASSDSSRGPLAIPKYNYCFDHWTALPAGAKPGCSS